MLKLLTLMLVIYSAHAEIPFWKAKAKAVERIENHEVLVSVTAHDRSPESPRYRLHATGGGQANAPCDFVYKTAGDYAKLSRLSGYIDKSAYDPATHILEVTISAFFHKATIGLKVDERPKEIKMQVISGGMKGFWWITVFNDTGRDRCEIGLDGEYNYDHFPIAKVFLEFGIEVVFRHMAERLRAYAEGEFGKLEVDNRQPPVKEFQRSKSQL